MIFREPEYESLSPEAKARWHLDEASRIQNDAKRRVLRGHEADAAYILAHRHQRVARLIMSASTDRARRSAAA